MRSLIAVTAMSSSTPPASQGHICGATSKRAYWPRPRRFFAPQIERAFPDRLVQPYGVAAAVYAMDRLYQATGEAAYARWRDHARAWFDGRNAASQPVYDRVNGRVSDGIDDGRLNPHSGAESNIVGAQALLPDVAARVGTLLDEVADRLEVAAA